MAGLMSILACVDSPPIVRISSRGLLTWLLFVSPVVFRCFSRCHCRHDLFLRSSRVSTPTIHSCDPMAAKHCDRTSVYAVVIHCHSVVLLLVGFSTPAIDAVWFFLWLFVSYCAAVGAALYSRVCFPGCFRLSFTPPLLLWEFILSAICFCPPLLQSAALPCGICEVTVAYARPRDLIVGLRHLVAGRSCSAIRPILVVHETQITKC
jgi:hypothetical protein